MPSAHEAAASLAWQQRALQRGDAASTSPPCSHTQHAATLWSSSMELHAHTQHVSWCAAVLHVPELGHKHPAWALSACRRMAQPMHVELKCSMHGLELQLQHDRHIREDVGVCQPREMGWHHPACHQEALSCARPCGSPRVPTHSCPPPSLLSDPGAGSTSTTLQHTPLSCFITVVEVPWPADLT